MSKNQFQWIIAIIALTIMIIVVDYFVEKHHTDIAIHLKINPGRIINK